MRHLLDVDELSGEEIESILEDAEAILRGGDVRAADLSGSSASGSGASGSSRGGSRVALLFAEASTRTRLSFEMAARNLGAETFLIEPSSSSMAKGETLVDTARNLDALGFDVLVLRHHRAGAPWVAARYFGGAVVNAGDGWHAHPTQALLDLLTLRRAFGGAAGLRGRKITIVGDILHSRVARSNAWTLSRAGAEVWLCGPPAWLGGPVEAPATRTSDLGAALDGAHAVMGLRVQRERMAAGSLSLDEYVASYQVTESRLAGAAVGAFYLHPGPINEGIEVTREVARGPRSLVLEQVRNGIPLRMAVLGALAAGQERRVLSSVRR